MQKPKRNYEDYTEPERRALNFYSPELLTDLPQEKVDFLIHYKMGLGIVSYACQAVGFSRATFYNWIKADANFKAAVMEAEDVALDFVEGKLYENIKAGDTTSIIFYLKCKGKKRGYIEKSHIEIDDARKELPKKAVDDILSGLLNKNKNRIAEFN